MREFRFRGINPKTGKIVSPAKILNNFTPTKKTKDGFSLNSKFILQSSTGLFDQDGEEIYEGDIVEETYWVSDDDPNSMLVFEKTYKYKIEWDNRQYYGFRMIPVDPDKAPAKSLPLYCFNQINLKLKVVDRVFDKKKN